MRIGQGSERPCVPGIGDLGKEVYLMRIFKKLSMGMGG